MKNLKDYILENIEESPSKIGSGNYRTITLKKRTGIDCSKISKEKFIKLMSEDYDEAIKIGNGLLDKEYEESRDKRIEKVRKNAEEYANSKWKRDSKKKEYIENAIKNEFSRERNHWHDFSSFDFDSSFGRRDGATVIRKEYKESDFGHIYDNLVNDKYNYEFFKDSIGWAFKYTAEKNNYRNCFRPWIDLIVSDSKKEEIEKNKEHLAASIERFYSNSNYWGD